MSDRKVLNKYFPPDWDPALLPRTTKPKNAQVMVRLMLPMTVQCAKCGDYIHKGKKFNGRKEEAVGENYLGIKIWRFYLKCPTCLSEITFKTDPARNDYVLESGGSRNFEPWKQVDMEEKLEKARKQREEMGDTMKVLENRTEASKREMELQDVIEEVKELNARAQMIDTDTLMAQRAAQAAKWKEEEIEAMAAEAFAKNGTSPTLKDGPGADGGESTPPAVIKRLPDPVDLSDSVLPRHSTTLGDLEVPDSPGAASSTDAIAAAAAASATSNSTTPSMLGSGTLPSTASLAANAATNAPLAGLVLIKKRKTDGGTDKEKKKKKRKDKDKDKDKASNGTETSTSNPTDTQAEANDGGGLGGLLGNYGDDSD